MDLQKKETLSASASCSICLEDVLDRGGGRSIAKLHCGHEFHLDCIGSAFNAKGAMQCPNCRKVETGRWLYANGHRLSSDFDIEGWMSEDIFDIGYSELPFGLQWYPFRGFTQLESVSEDAEQQPNSYHELMRNSAIGDHSSALNTSHLCPYLALHGFAIGVHTMPSAPENDPFHRHPSSFGGQSPSEAINSHNFPITEPQNQSWQHQRSHSFPLPGNSEQSTSHYGLRLSRNEANNQQRLGSFVHPHPFMLGSIPRSGNSIVGSLGPPIMGEVRGHARGHGNHLYQQSLSSTLRSSHFSPVNRIRPRGMTLVSSLATSPSTEIGGFYGFSISGSVNRSRQEGDNVARHDRFYTWGRDVNSLPWIPVESESQWWSPFNPNQNPQPGSFSRLATTERVTQNHQENRYQGMQPPYM